MYAIPIGVQTFKVIQYFFKIFFLDNKTLYNWIELVNSSINLSSQKSTSNAAKILRTLLIEQGFLFIITVQCFDFEVKLLHLYLIIAKKIEVE